MTDEQQATKDVEDASPPGKMGGVTGGEDVAERDGREAADMDMGTSGAGRPAGGRTAVDPMRVGQQEDGYRERGTVDPDEPDPSGGPNT